ncbi:MAG: MFS transporter, partial [Burkholderiales bacterium]
MNAPGRLTPVQLTLLLYAAEVFSMTGFAAYTTLLPVLQREWGLSNSEAGLVSGIYYAGYVMATPILTSLTDRVDARRVYLIACLISCAGAAGFMLFAGGLASALFFQFLIGAGLGGSYMPGLKMLTDLLEGPVQSRGIAFYTATFGIGST